jgi:GNAT superfamily N-acetyltransferase
MRCRESDNGRCAESVAQAVGEKWNKAPPKRLLDVPTFVAVSDGPDVGLVRCARDEARADTAWLISVRVAPEMRRRGVGAALVDAVIDWARSRGLKRLLLKVSDRNAPAIALYTQKGFTANGEVSTLPPPRNHIREHQLELRLS